MIEKKHPPDYQRQEIPLHLVHEWSTRLAEAVAPEEIDLAPILAEAFVQGGKAREELFRTSGSLIGGFSVAGVKSVIPTLFSALLLASPFLLNLLPSQPTGAFLDSVKSALTVIELKFKAKNIVHASSAGPDRSSSGGDVFDPLNKVITIIGQELRSSGLDAERSDLITFRVLRVLLEDSRGAAQFIQAINERR